MKRLTLLMAMTLTLPAVMPLGCAGSDAYEKSDSKAEPAPRSSEGDDDDASFAPSDRGAEAGETDGAGAAPESEAMQLEEAQPSERRTRAQDSATESEPAEDSNWLGFLSVFDGDDEAPHERKPKKERVPAAQPSRAYPWMATRGRPRVLVRPAVRTGSWGLSNALVREGLQPLPERIRPQDFINAPDYGYPPADDGAWSSLSADLCPAGNGLGGELLRIGLKLDAQAMRAADVTLLLDASERSSAAALDAWRDLVERSSVVLRATDSLSVITLGETVTAAADVDLETPLASVPAYPKGNASLPEGLVAAYQHVTSRPRDAQRIVIVFATTTAINEIEAVRRRIHLLRQAGAHVSLVSSVRARQPDADFLSFARQGGGAHLFVDETLDEAPASQVRAMRSLLGPALSGAEVEVRFDPRAVARYRLIGYQRRDSMRQARSPHPTLGREQEVTLLFEVQRSANAATDQVLLGSVQVRATGVRTRALDVQANVHTSLEAAPLSMRRAVVAASLAETLRGAQPLVEGRERWLALAAGDVDLVPLVDASKDWTTP